MNWKLRDGRVIHLVRPHELKALPSGTILIAIDGEQVVKGLDMIDDDTRGGFLAYGVLDPAILVKKKSRRKA